MHQLTISVFRCLSAGVHSNPNRSALGPCLEASLEPSAEVAPEWRRLQPLLQSGALLPLVPSVTCRGGPVSFGLLLTHLRRAPLWAPAGPRAGNKAGCRKATSLFARRGHPDHSPRASPFQCATVTLRRTLDDTWKTRSYPPTIGVWRKPSSTCKQGGRCLWVREFEPCLSKFGSRHSTASREQSTWPGQWKDFQ